MFVGSLMTLLFRVFTRTTIRSDCFQHYCQVEWSRRHPNGLDSRALWRMLSPDKPAPDCNHHRVSPVMNFEFLQQIPYVHLHSVFAD